MLCFIIDVCFEVPLRRDVIGAFLRSLIVSLCQKISDLLQVHLAVSIINTIYIPAPIEIIRISSYVVRVVPDKVGVVSSEVRITVNVNSVVSVTFVIRSERRTRVSAVIVNIRIPIVAYIRTYSVERGGGNLVNSRRAGRTRSRSAELIIPVKLIPGRIERRWSTR